jgi:peptidoglycan-associated lipoprotein
MKRAFLLNLIVVGLVLVVGAAGCRGKRLAKGVTPIPPPPEVVVPADTTPKPPIESTRTAPPPPVTGGAVAPKDTGATAKPLVDTGPGISTAAIEEFEGMVMDPDQLKAETVYFDFDQSAVKPKETSKAESVAGYLKEKADTKLLIDGHCDERGTEEYNRALGERRALALREYLARVGIAPERIRTRSWGEDQPADAGHDDAAWAKNRRGEFILLLPKK